jgi:hypothetical protein
MNKTIRKNGLTFGLISGVVSVLITAIIYSVNLNLFLSGWITFLKISLFITFAITLILTTKKELQNNLGFKDTFTTYFLFAVTSLFISTLFEVILFNLIDPSLKETLKEMSIKYAVELLQKFDTPAAKINEAIKNIKDNDQFAILQLIKGYFTYLLISCILGLILSGIFKSKNTSEL